MQIAELREVRGQAIAHADGQIQRLDESHYYVLSQSGNGRYAVVATEAGWNCECPDYQNRPFIGRCKHIWGVEFSQTMRRRVENQMTIHQLALEGCPRCKSQNVKARGLRHNKLGDIQRFYCKECDYWFSLNLGFEGMRATPEIITSAMQLYFTGESYRNVVKFLRLKGAKFSHVAVYGWVKKYVGLMGCYLDQITPQVSGVWRTDELYVKVKGDMKYVFALMDDETRFWIAQQVADTKGTSDITPMFREAKRRSGKRPTLLISDGAPNFHDAFRREFGRPFSQHIQDIRLDGTIHNNKMERMNGEVRDREKVMRGVKSEKTPALKGYEIFHNYVREHEGLKGQTPAEACGIKVEGDNKWLTLIQNSAKKVESK